MEPPLYYALGALAVVLLAMAGWWVFGQGPRNRRALRHAHHLLRQGRWQDALAIVQGRQSRGKLSFTWQGRFWRAEGDCQRVALQAALEEKRFDQALDHALRAAHLLKAPEAEARAEVLAAMLAETRRLFSANLSTPEIHQVIDGVFKNQNPCPEASFWRGLCHVRDNRLDVALADLQVARQSSAGQSPDASAGTSTKPAAKTSFAKTAFIDPPLYLGALLVRQGQPKEALRYLTEANRLDANCPFVAWQLGTAMLAAGGDAALAVRALQRTLGPRGFLLWKEQPQRAWVEGFPEKGSYVRKLATKHSYTCPLWGSDLMQVLRQGNIALGQGLYRLGQFKEAGEVFGKLMQESAPTLPVLRGYGLALARLGQYDQAFKHLRAAHELEEEPKDRLTAGYLALCGAKGTPVREEDKPRNIDWAIRLVTQFNAPGDAEWAGLISAVFADARRLDMPIDRDDQLYLCEHLVKVHATDPLAADAYHHLQATFPALVHSEYAWLYCRAAQAHGVTGPKAPELFAIAFSDAPPAREFFQRQGWNFDDLEVAYLERAAAHAPGAFPAALGPDYPPHGEALLLSRSRQQEQANQLELALATANTLIKLAPASPAALDRLAYLTLRRGDRERASWILEDWHVLHPRDPLPLLRQAVLLQVENPAHSLEKIRQVLGLLEGPRRAAIAYLGARLMMQGQDFSSGAPAVNGDGYRLKAARALLEDCLQREASHAGALWLLAALLALDGRRDELAQLAPRMDRPDVTDARFHFLAGVCHLASGSYAAALDACLRLGTAGENASEFLGVESSYLAALAHLGQGERAAAVKALSAPAQAPSSPSCQHARAWLGVIRFQDGMADRAIQSWQSLDAKCRSAWNFTPALAGTVFLTALKAMQAGDYANAADKIREAGRLGWRDRRLGHLLTLSLVKAGQQLLYGEVGSQ